MVLNQFLMDEYRRGIIAIEYTPSKENLQLLHLITGKDYSGSQKYYFCEGATRSAGTCKPNRCDAMPISQFIKTFTMNRQIKKELLYAAHKKFGCPDWQNAVALLLKNNWDKKDSDLIDIPEHVFTAIRRSANTVQKAYITQLGIMLPDPLEVRLKSLGTKHVTSETNEFLLSDRRIGEYAGQGFILSKEFTWSIVKDKQGEDVLIPRRKREQL